MKAQIWLVDGHRESFGLKFGSLGVIRTHQDSNLAHQAHRDSDLAHRGSSGLRFGYGFWGSLGAIRAYRDPD